MNSLFTKTIDVVEGTFSARAVAASQLRSGSARVEFAGADKACLSVPTIGIAKGENRLADGMGTKGYWVQTVDFGHTRHSQRWRFAT